MVKINYFCLSVRHKLFNTSAILNVIITSFNSKTVISGINEFPDPENVSEDPRIVILCVGLPTLSRDNVIFMSTKLYMNVHIINCIHLFLICTMICNVSRPKDPVQ